MNTNGEDIDKLKVQRELKEKWEEMAGGQDDGGAAEGTQAEVCGTIEDAVHRCREIQRDVGGAVQVLCTGSVHLVGGVMEVLEGQGVGEGGRT